MNHTSINVATTSDYETALRFKAIIEADPTYMKFVVNISPYQGEWYVNVATDYTSDNIEATNMLLFLLFGIVSKETFVDVSSLVSCECPNCGDSHPSCSRPGCHNSTICPPDDMGEPFSWCEICEALDRV